MSMAAEPTLTLTAAGKRVPDFFIVGAPKSGTTSLFWMLRQHPQIFMPDLKEPRFLATDAPARPGFTKFPREGKRPQTLDDYLALFEGAEPGQRVGEATTFYLWSRAAPIRIAELQPQARIIAVLREPVSFLHSLHLTNLLISYESERDLRKAMSLEPARREGRQIPRFSARPQVLYYSEHVRYVEKLRRYHDQFPPEHVLVLIYDDLWGDTQATVRRVLRFLDVDEDYPIKSVRTNVTKRAVRAPGLKHLLESLALIRPPNAKSGPVEQRVRKTVRMIRRRVVMRDPPARDESFAMELRRRFKPEVVALSEYLDRDLVTLWGYDKVGD
jgi:hypothetical protein